MHVHTCIFIYVYTDLTLYLYLSIYLFLYILVYANDTNDNITVTNDNAYVLNLIVSKKMFLLEGAKVDPPIPLQNGIDILQR